MIINGVDLTPQKIVSDEEWKKAEKEINATMEKFSMEHRAYIGRSKAAAATAYCG
jgi:hypothetical protein